MRADDLPRIAGVAAFDEGLRAVPRDTEILVIDAPARTHGTEMNELVRRAETILVPVLPSPIDMKACAHFMGELLELGKVQRQQARLAVVANRVRENTLMYEELDQYLGKLKVPYLASLRQSTNYLRAFQRGMGIFELPEYLAWPDWKQWEPIMEWLGSKKSQPEQPSARLARIPSSTFPYLSTTPRCFNILSLLTRRDSLRNDRRSGLNVSCASSIDTCGGAGRPAAFATRLMNAVELNG